MESRGCGHDPPGMRQQQFRPNRGDLILGPASMVRGMAELYEARVAEMDGLVDGWDERDCTGELADQLDALICPDYHHEVSGGAAVAGFVGAGIRRGDVRPVEARADSAFAEVSRG